MLLACPECGGDGISGMVPEVCFYCEGLGVVDEEPDDRPDLVDFQTFHVEHDGETTGDDHATDRADEEQAERA